MSHMTTHNLLRELWNVLL